MSKKLRLKWSAASYNQKNVPDGITHKISETNSSFHMKYPATRKV